MTVAGERADAAFDAAVDWMVLLCSGEAGADDRSRFEHWRAADPLHEAAWAKVAGALGRSVAPLQRTGQAGAVTSALLRPRLSRRGVLRGVAALALVGGVAALADRRLPLGSLTADLRTGTGERRRFALPDGSTVLLNARSAADIDFSGGRRRIRLRAGELIAHAAADPHRPFVVATAHGSVRALGTRFLVRQEALRSAALVLEHSVAVSAGGRETVLQEGQGLWFDAQGPGAPRADLADRATWQDGMLTVHDRPLAEVIEAVRSYHGGYIRLSPAAAQLRVLGAFPLDDTDRLLESLAQTLPIRISRYAGWLVLIDRS